MQGARGGVAQISLVQNEVTEPLGNCVLYFSSAYDAGKNFEIVSDLFSGVVPSGRQ